MKPLGHVSGGAGGYAPSGLLLTLMSSSQNDVTGNGQMIAPPEHVNLEELVGLSPRSTISDDYLAGASPQMSEDEDAAESIETPPDNMPESSHPSSLVWNFAPLLSWCMGLYPAQKCVNIRHECIALKHANHVWISRTSQGVSSPLMPEQYGLCPLFYCPLCGLTAFPVYSSPDTAWQEVCARQGGRMQTACRASEHLQRLA